MQGLCKEQIQVVLAMIMKRNLYKNCIHVHVIQGTRNTTVMFQELAQGTHTRNVYKVYMQGYVYRHVVHKEYVQGIAKGST